MLLYTELVALKKKLTAKQTLGEDVALAAGVLVVQIGLIYYFNANYYDRSLFHFEMYKLLYVSPLGIAILAYATTTSWMQCLIRLLRILLLCFMLLISFVVLTGGISALLFLVLGTAIYSFFLTYPRSHQKKSSTLLTILACTVLICGLTYFYYMIINGFFGGIHPSGSLPRISN